MGRQSNTEILFRLWQITKKTIRTKKEKINPGYHVKSVKLKLFKIESIPFLSAIPNPKSNLTFSPNSAALDDIFTGNQACFGRVGG